MPLVIHARDADEDVAAILEEEMAKGAFPAVLHCFTGGAELARRGLALGLYISFSGILTFKKSDALREIAADVPLDRLLVETDAPYLAPGKYRGKRNEPAYVVRHGRRARQGEGRYRSTELARATTENFFRLYAKAPRAARSPHEPHASRCSAPAPRAACRASATSGAPAIRPIRRTGGGAARCWSSASARAAARRVLVDTPPDLREQLLDARVETLDGVLFTHDHADHTHGIDDLRGVFFNMRRRIHVYADARRARPWKAASTTASRRRRARLYPAILQAHDISPPEPVRIDGAGGAIEAVPILQEHGDVASLGFRFGNVAYSPDISGIPESSLPLLQGLDLWIVDALRPMPHPSHFTVKQALDWIERLGVKRAILTHMTVELDYEALRRELPPHVEPAYDGMVVEVD